MCTGREEKKEAKEKAEEEVTVALPAQSGPRRVCGGVLVWGIVCRERGCACLSNANSAPLILDALGFPPAIALRWNALPREPLRDLAVVVTDITYRCLDEASW
jgi:hypothetical protein